MFFLGFNLDLASIWLISVRISILRPQSHVSVALAWFLAEKKGILTEQRVEMLLRFHPGQQSLLKRIS